MPMKGLVAGVVAMTAFAAKAGAVAVPHVIFVWFADGRAAPAPGICGAHTPPPYRCSFAASTKECQAQIMRELAGLYRDFDVKLVTADPTPAPHFTVIVTSADAS